MLSQSTLYETDLKYTRQKNHFGKTAKDHDFDL